jgi:hypothetical protein
MDFIINENLNQQFGKDITLNKEESKSLWLFSKYWC